MPRTSVFLRNSAWLPSVVCGRAGAEHCLLLRPVHSLGALPTAARRCTSTPRSSRAGRGARPATSRPPHMLCTSCPASRVCLQLEGRCTKRLCLRLTRSQPSLLRRAGAPRRPGRPAPVAVRAPQHPARHTCFVHPAPRPECACSWRADVQSACASGSLARSPRFCGAQVHLDAQVVPRRSRCVPRNTPPATHALYILPPVPCPCIGHWPLLFGTLTGARLMAAWGAATALSREFACDC